MAWGWYVDAEEGTIRAGQKKAVLPTKGKEMSVIN